MRLNQIYITRVRGSHMATASKELFDWLTEERLESLVIKLNRLPTGSEFERKAVEGMKQAIGANRLYKGVKDEHGDLVGYVEEERLPWWLDSFNWTVDSDPTKPLELGESNLDDFDLYPDSTQIEEIELSGAESFIEGLESFAALSEEIASSLDGDITASSSDIDFDPGEYELPDKMFMIPEEGRISTSDEFEEWFERVINLCPPASPEMTALLRVNTNIPRRHAEEALSQNQIGELERLGILQSQPSDEEERVHKGEYSKPIAQLLEMEAPFDLDIEISNEKEDLTDLQYAYYRAWAKDANRVPGEQEWLNKAKNKDSTSEGEMYRFSEHAFRIPVKINSKYSNDLVFEDENSSRRKIAEVLEEYGHPVKND